MNSLRLALRQLAKSPGFTFTAVLTLALGIGATTAIFSVIHAVLLNPFPYKDGNRIIFAGSARIDQANSFFPVTYPDYLDWRRDVRSVEHLAYASGSSATLTGVTEPVTLRNAAVTANAWPLLGMAPVLGRVFGEAEDRPGAEPVCLLSQGTWEKHFNRDPAILGRAITLDGKPYTVIGVMPAQFKFWAGDVWTPVGLQADTDAMRSRVLRMDSWVVTRPVEGKTLTDVSTELGVIAARIARAHPDSNKDVGVSLRYLREAVSGQMRDPLMLLLSAVGAVLLIACANVANLFLARTSARQREFAVRAALGASRAQLIRQTLVESIPLALLGGGAGLAFASWGLDGLLAIIPADTIPAEAQISVNGPVLLFSFAVTIGTMLLFALFPAWESSRAAVGHGLQEGGRSSASSATNRVRAGLIIAEVSLSLILLVGAGLLIRSLDRMSALDLGFDRRNLLVVPVQLPEARYGGTEQATALFENAVARLKEVPGVVAVAASTNAPYAAGSDFPLSVEGRTYTDIQQIDSVQFSLVTPDYFRAQGLASTRGRTFDGNDRAGTAPVIILNEAAVKKFLPEGDPLGKRVMLGAPGNLVPPGMLPPGLDQFQWATVVGVVRNVYHFGPAVDPLPAAYIPVRQGWDYAPMRRFMLLLLRTQDDPTALVPALRSIIGSLDPDLPLQRITTMDSLVDNALQGARFNVVLLGLFAGVALALAGVGIYGVVSWHVSQRTREIGIRLALGADHTNVLRLVVAQSMRVVGIGLLLGLAGALALVRVMQSQLFGISAFDLPTFAGVTFLLGATALLASTIPARRATRVNPIEALRAE